MENSSTDFMAHQMSIVCCVVLEGNKQVIHFTTIHSTQISKVMALHYICKMFKMQISVVAECTYEMFFN